MRFDAVLTTERLQYRGYLRRKDIDAEIMALVRDGMPLKEIVRRTGHSHKLVRQVSRAECPRIENRNR